MNYLKEILHRYSPIFAALASLRLRSRHALREKFRVSVAVLPRWVLRGGLLRINYQQRETLH